MNRRTSIGMMGVLATAAAFRPTPVAAGCTTVNNGSGSVDNRVTQSVNQDNSITQIQDNSVSQVQQVQIINQELDVYRSRDAWCDFLLSRGWSIGFTTDLSGQCTAGVGKGQGYVFEGKGPTATFAINQMWDAVGLASVNGYQF